MIMIINSKNVTIKNRALEVLKTNTPIGSLSSINNMPLVTIMLYTYGGQFTDKSGHTIKNDHPNYLLGKIKPGKLKDEIIVELSNDKFIAIRFEFPFSEEKIYIVDFDGEHLIVY